jgi:hypothetical protein
VGWVHRGIGKAVLRTQANHGADILLVMGDGSREPLWGVEKPRDDTDRRFTRSRQPLAPGKTIEEVSGYLNLSGQQISPGTPVIRAAGRNRLIPCPFQNSTRKPGQRSREVLP